MALYLSAQPTRMQQIGHEVLELSDDPWIQANVHTWLAFSARLEGNIELVAPHLTRFEELVGSGRDYWLLYYLHTSKALSAFDKGDFVGCRQILEHMLTLVKAINMKRGLHQCLQFLGVTAIALEDLDAAQAYCLESMRVSEELGETTENVGALVDLAKILSATGETTQALEMAATAFAHPLSVHVTILNREPIRERAEALRASLAGAVPPEQAEAAWQRGLAADFDRVLADLLDTPSMAQIAIRE